MAKTSTAAKLRESAKKEPEMNTAPVAETTKPKGLKDEVFRIALRDIGILKGWNSRNDKLITRVVEADSKSSPRSPEDSLSNYGGSAQLEKSLEDGSQDTPVDVRENDGADPKVKTPYIMVTGNRRFHALTQIAKRGGNLKGDPTWTPLEPTIKAKIHKGMNAYEARALNIRENMQREPLIGADIAFSLQDLLKNKPKDEKLTQTELAAIYGRTQPYMSMLIKIVSETNVGILRDWRDSENQLPIPDMLKVAAKDTEKQAKLYDDLKKNRHKGGVQESTDGAPATPPTAADLANGVQARNVERAVEKVKEIGNIMGQLVAFGAVHPSTIDWDALANYFAPVKQAQGATLTVTMSTRVVDAMRDAYEGGIKLFNEAEAAKAAAVTTTGAAKPASN